MSGRAGGALPPAPAPPRVDPEVLEALGPSAVRPWREIADLVHVLGLSDTGAIPPDVAGRLLGSVLRLAEGASPDLVSDGRHDEHRERLQRGVLGEDARWLRVGRGDREVRRTVFLLTARELLLGVHESARGLAAACRHAARSHANAWWPLRTVPDGPDRTPAAAYLLSVGHECARHLDRAERARQACEKLPLRATWEPGTAAIASAGASFDRLGIGSAPPAAAEASLAADALIEVAHVATQAALTTSRLAEDLRELAMRLHVDDTRAALRPLASLRGRGSRLLARASGLVLIAHASTAQSDVDAGHADALQALAEASGLMVLMTPVLGAVSAHPVLPPPDLTGTDVAPFCDGSASSRRLARRLARARRWEHSARAAQAATVQGVLAEAAAAAHEAGRGSSPSPTGEVKARVAVAPPRVGG